LTRTTCARYIDALFATFLTGEEVSMRSSVIAVAVVLTMGLVSSVGRAQTPDPIVGTWHLNVQKSKFSPGPPPKSIVLTFEQTAPGTMKATADTVEADGQPRKTEFTTTTDGKDTPLAGSPIADTVSLKTDGNKRVRVDKKGGKVVMTYNGTISPDGKTFTVDAKGTNPKGEAVHNQLVFEKR
jgi:hypothetical protein